MFVFAAVALGVAGPLWSFSQRPGALASQVAQVPSGDDVQRALPSLDQNLPEKTETALFALG